MPNQYNTPRVVNHDIKNNYTSQYVGLPLEAMEANLLAHQKGYDTTENLGIQTKTSLGGIQHYGDYAGKYVSNKQKELEDFVKSYDGKDLGNSQISKAFKQKANDIASDGELADINAKAGLVKQFQANISDMQKSGDLYQENIYAHKKALERYSKTGNFGNSNFDPSITKGVNIEEEAEKYYKALHEDGAETIRKIADGAGGSLYYDQSNSGISGSKIQNQASRLFGEFSKSQAGQQLARRYEMETDGKGSEQGKIQYMAKTFLQAGQGFQYSKSSSNMSAALDKKEDMKRKKKEVDATMEIPFVEAAGLGDHLELDEKSGLPKGTGGLWEKMGQTLKESGSYKQAGKAAWDYLLNGKAGSVFTESDIKKLAPSLDAIDTINRERVKNKQTPLSPQEYYQARQSSAEKKRQLVSTVSLDSKTIKGYKDALVSGGAIMGLPALNPNDPSNKNETVGSTLRKLMDVSDKEPITADMLKDHNIQIAGLPSKSGYTPRGLNIFVDGKPIIADMGYHMLTPGYKPKDANEAKELNEYNASQSELKGGSHTFTGYILDGNKIVEKRVKAVYDPTTGESIIKPLK